MRIWLTLFSVLLSLASNGQKFKPAIGIGLNLGIPTGMFASTDVSNDESGKGQTGFGFDLTCQLQPTSGKVGLMGAFRFVSFSYDVEAVADYISQVAPPGQWSGQASNWETMSFLVGPFINILKKESLVIGPHLMIGVMIVSEADRIVSGRGYSGSVYTANSFSHTDGSTAFTWELGIAMRSRISPKVFFTASADFLDASHTSMGYNLAFTINGDLVSSESGTFTQPVSAVVLNAGFLFLLK